MNSHQRRVARRGVLRLLKAWFPNVPTRDLQDAAYVRKHAGLKVVAGRMV